MKRRSKDGNVKIAWLPGFERSCAHSANYCIDLAYWRLHVALVDVSPKGTRVAPSMACRGFDL